MSKKITRKVLVAVFALVLSVVALGTTTYAWFTLGNTVKVAQFQMNVSGGEGLEMTYVTKGGSEKGYVSTILTEDIISYLEADYYGKSEGQWANEFQLYPVTSVDGKLFKKLDKDDNYSLADTTAHTDNHFVEFKLKFRTKAETQKLVWNQVELTSSGVNWSPEVDFTAVGGNTVTKGSDAVEYFAKDGARISVEPTDGTTVVYELPLEGTNKEVLSNEKPNFTQGAHDYFHKVTGVNLEDTYGGYKAAETITAVSSTYVMDFVDTGDPAGYYYAQVTVRVYLEGFDAETFNAILSDDIKVALGFTISGE